TAWLTYSTTIRTCWRAANSSGGAARTTPTASSRTTIASSSRSNTTSRTSWEANHEGSCDWCAWSCGHRRDRNRRGDAAAAARRTERRAADRQCDVHEVQGSESGEERRLHPGARAGRSEHVWDCRDRQGREGGHGRRSAEDSA